ncbi:MAG: PAS domain-containing protein [Halobacteriales archaeon]
MSAGDDHGDVYRELFEAVSDAILVYDPADGTVVDANPAAATLTGYDVEDLIGAPVATFSAGDPGTVEYTASGIGLVSVGDIVSGHDWILAIPETRGGARFEFRFEGGAPERGLGPEA